MTLLLFFLLHLFLPLSLAAVNPCSSPSTPGDIQLLHINNKCSPSTSPPQITTFNSLLQLTQHIDPARLSFLASLSSAPIAYGKNIDSSSIYILRAAIGSPPQPILLSLDSAADASFLSSSNFSSSSTFQPLPCSSSLCPLFTSLPCSSPPSLCTYNQSYGGDSSFSAALSQDALHLAADTVPTFAFGAITSATPGPSFPKQGLLGFGRGPASLLSQTKPLYNSIFSYCLPSYNSYYFSGSLRLGPLHQPARIRSTPPSTTSTSPASASAASKSPPLPTHSPSTRTPAPAPSSTPAPSSPVSFPPHTPRYATSSGGR